MRDVLRAWSKCRRKKRKTGLLLMFMFVVWNLKFRDIIGILINIKFGVFSLSFQPSALNGAQCNAKDV